MPQANIIATVNGVPIDDKALAAAMQGLAQEQFHATLEDVPETEHAGLREMALERLIARELIYQAALAQGVVATQEEIDAEKARIVRMAGNPKDFWSRLAERGMDEAAFVRMVRKDVTADLMSARRLENLPDPVQEEIESFFHRHSDQLRRPERVRASHILFPIDPQDPDQASRLAEEVRALAKEGDFGTPAQKFSSCPSAPGGGDLGLVRRQELDPTFSEAVFSAVVGEVIGPVRTPFGLHLIKVSERDLPGLPTLEESRTRIIDLLKRIKGGELLSAWVEELRQEAQIVILE